MPSSDIIWLPEAVYRDAEKAGFDMHRYGILMPIPKWAEEDLHNALGRKKLRIAPQQET
jgi:hypothetical protein